MESRKFDSEMIYFRTFNAACESEKEKSEGGTEKLLYWKLSNLFSASVHAKYLKVKAAKQVY